MKYRHRLELITAVLSAALKGEKKTHIMNMTNLNYKLITYYLKLVLRSGFMVYDSTNNFYFVTDKGKYFMAIFKDYKKQLLRSQKRLRTVETKKVQLENMCFPGNMA